MPDTKVVDNICSKNIHRPYFVIINIIKAPELEVILEIIYPNLVL